MASGFMSTLGTKSNIFLDPCRKESHDGFSSWWLNQPILKNMRKSNWIISARFGVNIKHI